MQDNSTSKLLSSTSMEYLDQKVQENENEMLNMEMILENKRMEIHELQHYLIEEFESMEAWKDKKDKINDVMSVGVIGILKDIRALMENFVAEYKVIFCTLMKESLQVFKKKLWQQQKQIMQKNNQIACHQKVIERMKYDLNKTNRACFPNSNIINVKEPRQMSRSLSHNKFTNKSMSKSSFLDFNVVRMKSRQKYQLSRSSLEEQKHQKSIQQQNKLTKSSTAKKIMFEVQKTLKEDFQNQRYPGDHKKYVKQKIQCLKNKNSNYMFDQTQISMKARRF